VKPVHIVTDKENISELVLMPGDPLRAKYIADNFLETAKLVNTVRNMLGFTGTYKGTPITVIGSGMGIPSMGIYSYELAHFYGVKKIIRIGSAGAMNPDVKVRDIVVATESHSLSTFALSYSGDESKIKKADDRLIEDIKASIKDASVKFGPIVTSDTFDPYAGHMEENLKMLGVSNPLACEMEAFGLYHVGEVTGIQTVAMMTITDSSFTPELDLSSEERETSLNEMIRLALEAIVK